MKTKALLFFIIFSCLGVLNLRADSDYYCYAYSSGVRPYCDDGYTCYRPQEEKITVVLVKKTFPKIKKKHCISRTTYCHYSSDLPYGYMDDEDDDEVRSPWSKAWVPTSGRDAGQVLYDPNTSKPFLIPPFGDDYLE